MNPKFMQYEHHNNKVWTATETKGKHRAHCLCYSCELFAPDTSENCAIANKVFELCVRHSLVTPVFECPIFLEKK